MTDYIALADCEDRRLYRIHSRNLMVGVFRERTGGFIGIRTKFGDRYLFEEYHWDRGAPYGTVKPTEALDAWVDPHILLAESLEGTWCSGHDRLVVFKNTEGYGDGQPAYEGQPRTKGTWFHTDDGTELVRPDYPCGKGNKVLFDLIEPYDTAAAEAWRAEYGDPGRF